MTGVQTCALPILQTFNFVFLYGLVFFFLFEMVVDDDGFLFWGFVDDGFGIEKSCVLMKFLVFLGVAL